ncbi:hypothetical protein E2C01_075157 [Portunus trituberculatus]|uniref:Uncharacterized protein n=1 Tax=Portunus trituberculatus TaxID=210409 RepID=A0A5B7IEC7_PORTR|nr:hypothetical protein [Portunus trituberculatus]
MPIISTLAVSRHALVSLVLVKSTKRHLVISSEGVKCFGLTHHDHLTTPTQHLTILGLTTPHLALLYHSTPHHTIVYFTSPHNTTPQDTTPHNTTPHTKTQHHTTPH